MNDDLALALLRLLAIEDGQSSARVAKRLGLGQSELQRLLTTLGEDPRYDGGGTPPLEGQDGWHIPGHAAVVLQPTARAEHEQPALP